MDNANNQDNKNKKPMKITLAGYIFLFISFFGVSIVLAQFPNGRTYLAQASTPMLFLIAAAMIAAKKKADKEEQDDSQ